MSGSETQVSSGFRTLVFNEAVRMNNTRLSLAMFSSDFQPLYTRSHSHELGAINYKADGCTALYSSTVASINLLDETRQEQGDTGPVLFLIITDGGDNESQNFLESAQQLIAEKQALKVNPWTFVLLGDKMVDVPKLASIMGVPPENAEGYTRDNDGIYVNFETISGCLPEFRATGKLPVDWANPIRNHRLQLTDGLEHLNSWQR
ncbi:hypothetical protein FACS189425_10970 [Clostridia bacterium]|nr:hypothetical protein FACS189425_10970 [Clostridia bacterium]